MKKLICATLTGFILSAMPSVSQANTAHTPATQLAPASEKKPATKTTEHHKKHQAKAEKKHPAKANKKTV